MDISRYEKMIDTMIENIKCKAKEISEISNLALVEVNNFYSKHTDAYDRYALRTAFFKYSPEDTKNRIIFNELKREFMQIRRETLL